MTKPAPLTAAECDLQDFAFMPLDVVRLRDSELAANETPEACWAAVLLWAAAWHQVPAASMPDDDRWIARAAGYVARGKIDKAWCEVKPGAMRGFIQCSDGRWYHPVVAEKAREAWNSKLKQRWSTECARIKKANQRNRTSLCMPEFDEWLSLGCPQGQTQSVPRDKPEASQGTGGACPADVPRETPSKGQGEGQGHNLNTPPPTRAPDPDTEVFPIREDWRPSPAFAVQAKLAGLPVLDAEAMAEGLNEFRGFWLARPHDIRTQAEWENALAKSLKHRQVKAAGATARAVSSPRQAGHRAPTAAELRVYRSSPGIMDPDARARVEAHLGVSAAASQTVAAGDFIDMEASHGNAIGMD